MTQVSGSFFSKYLKVLGVFLIACLFSSVSVAQTPEHKSLSIQNEFIKLIVNDGKEDQGRFAVETTGGDPKNKLDDYKSLIFGRPIPWTSYSTVMIDGQLFVFGGPNLKIQKRAGKIVTFGEVLSQRISSENIITVCKFGPVLVTQTLTFFRNPSSKVKDSALIYYDILNTDSQPHSVGFRLMMDTKLGENDGAPFRIGSRSIESEVMFNQSEIQDFWQAFDSLVTPNVIAQGTLRFPDVGVFPPNRLYLANWGTLVDNPWEFDYQPGRSFVRQGELDKDTAMALYWDPVTVNPGDHQRLRTVYGLGGVSMSKGALSLGLTAPAEIYGSMRDILMVGYVTNTGAFDSRDTKVSFELPPSFVITDGQASLSLGTLQAGYTRQIPIKIKPVAGFSGPQTITFKVTSSTFSSNSISRTIDIIAPPGIQAKLDFPATKKIELNYFVDGKVTLTNDGTLPIDRIQVQMNPENGVSLPEFETPIKYISRLMPRQTETVNWKLLVTRPTASERYASVTIKSSVTEPKTVRSSFQTTYPQPSFVIIPSTQNITEGDYFYIWVDSNFIEPFQNQNLSLQWDSSISYRRYSAEEWIQPYTSTKNMTITSDTVSLTGVSNPSKMFQKRFLKLHFKAVKAGKSTAKLSVNGVTAQELELNIQPKAVSSPSTPNISEGDKNDKKN